MLRLHQEQGQLRLEAEGPVSQQEINRVLPDLERALAENPQDNLLIDLSRSQTLQEAEPLAELRLGERFPERDLRLALLAPESLLNLNSRTHCN